MQVSNPPTSGGFFLSLVEVNKSNEDTNPKKLC